MKNLKRIVTWSILALVLQSCVFFVANAYYKKTLLNTKVKEVKVEKTKEVEKDIPINIPTTSKEIEVSFDGKYVAYYNDSILNVISTYTGEIKTVNAEKDSQQIYYKWLPDVNSMILCERSLVNKTTVSIFNYNADNDKKQISTDSNNNDTKFRLYSSKNTIGDIEMSPMMQTFYIKVMKNSLQSDILNNDVNGNILSVFTNKNIGNINTFNLNSNLIYEDTLNNVVKVSNIGWSSGKIKACLFNTDNEDNIYIGVLKNNKVEKIMYGTTEKVLSKWTSIPLNVPVDKKNIIVTKSGVIYINNILGGNVTNQVTKNKIDYSGKLLLINDKKIISLDNWALKKINLP